MIVRVSRLAADRRARLKLAALIALMPLRDRLIGPRPTLARLRYGNRDLEWMLGPKSDIDVLNEILILEEYGDLPVRDPQVVVDLGAHAGVSLLYFRVLFSNARLIGIEPDPVTFQRLRWNAGQLQDVEVRQVALSDRDGDRSFFSAPQGWVSSLEGNGDAVKVTGRTLDTLFEELTLERIDLMKIDVEGGELALEASSRLADVGVIVGELHDFGSADRRARIMAALGDFEVEAQGGVGEHTTFVAVAR